MRSGVIITLIVLATAFGALFLHNWRLFEQNMQPKPVKAITDDSEEDDNFYEEIDPMLKKSVAFSVCFVDKEKMTFDLDRK